MFLDQLNARLAIKKQDAIYSSMSALDKVSLAVETQTTMEYEILKGLGKGSGRGRPKGSKNKNAPKGSVSAAPVATPSKVPSKAPDEDAYGHSAEDVHDAFNHSGGVMLGGTNFTPNVMMHKDKANMQIHAGAMHGHLQDSGFTKGTSTTDNGTTRTEYNHPNGTRVNLNEGTSSGGRNFVGYSHETKANRAADFADKPKESPAKGHDFDLEPLTPKDMPKALPAAAIPKNTSAIGSDGKVSPTKFKNGLTKVANLTDNNDHNMALYHGAKLIGRNDIAAKAKEISKQHMKQGYMSDDLIAQRGQLHNQLAEHAKKVLSPEQAHSLYMSY